MKKFALNIERPWQPVCEVTSEERAEPAVSDSLVNTD